MAWISEKYLNFDWSDPSLACARHGPAVKQVIKELAAAVKRHVFQRLSHR